MSESNLEKMFLGLGTATPEEKNINFTQGLRYAVLVFVFEKTQEQANKIAKEHLEGTGWKDVLIDKINVVDGEAIQQAQPDVIKAYEIALRDGSHAMVLEQPKST